LKYVIEQTILRTKTISERVADNGRQSKICQTVEGASACLVYCKNINCDFNPQVSGVWSHNISGYENKL
jgi:hypothetical protein